MAYSLASADSQTPILRDAYEAADANAKDAWSRFSDERSRLIDAGTDLQRDQKATKALDGLHKEYEAAADASKATHSAYLAHLEGKATGATPRRKT